MHIRPRHRCPRGQAVEISTAPPLFTSVFHCDIIIQHLLATTLIAIAVFTAVFFSIEVASLFVGVVQAVTGLISLFKQEDTHMDKKQFGLVGVAFGAVAFCWRVRVDANAVGSNPACLIYKENTL